MDDTLIDLVRDTQAAWIGMDGAEAEAALQAIADAYLDSQGYATATVEITDLDAAGYADAEGYYDDTSETIFIDDEQANSANFEDVLATVIEESEHAANYQDTGQGYPDVPDDGVAGVGAMAGDTLLIEARDEDMPVGHQLVGLLAEAVAAELMNSATGASSASAVSGTGGGSEPGGEVFHADPIDIDLSVP